MTALRLLALAIVLFLCGAGAAYLTGITLMLWNSNERRWM